MNDHRDVPELPEIEALSRWLGEQTIGDRVAEFRLRSVVALKTVEPPVSELAGTTVQAVGRRGKFLWIGVNQLTLVAHFSRGGWARYFEKSRQRTRSQGGPILAEVLFENGAVLDFTEHGHKKRAALWLVRHLDDVPRVRDLGPEALDPSLDASTFLRAVRAAPGTIKRVLADQHVVAGVGNAYSDEILHAAKVSPFLRASHLDEETTTRVYEAMRALLADAVLRSAQLAGHELKDDKRTHLRVHGRAGERCDVCDDVIREVWSGERSFQYCPTCQTGGKIHADNRMSRLLR